MLCKWIRKCKKFIEYFR